MGASHSDCVNYLQQLRMYPKHMHPQLISLYNKNGGDCGYLQELGLMDVLKTQGVTQAYVGAPVEINHTETHTHTENHFVTEAPVVNNVTTNHVESHTKETTVTDSAPTCVIDRSGTVNTGTEVFDTKHCDNLLVIL